VIAAVAGFDRVVLIAGGRNKGLDLGALGGVASHVVGVVGIGEAGPEVVAAFDGVTPAVPTTLASSMAEAVAAAAAMATAGDAVLLSPGCASFDWYENYGQRGDDFAARVRELIGSAP
jgi:UDP-N-acetylmuramoylalanine--D-glutamate ligase